MILREIKKLRKWIYKLVYDDDDDDYYYYYYYY